MGARLEAYAKFEDGWDSYDAKPPFPKTIIAVKKFLSLVKIPCEVRPSVVGGVGVTFRVGDKYVYLEFRNTGNTHLLFADRESKPTVEKVERDEVSYLKAVAKIEEFLNDSRRNH